MIKPSFNLDPQLESSSIWIQDLSLCQLRLKNDRRFPWVVLIPRRPSMTEIFDLTLQEQSLLWSEIATLAEQMHQTFQAYKMNIEILGNKVRQLHIHLIARYDTDAAWPNSVLNYGTADAYQPEEVLLRVQELSLAQNTLASI